MFHPSHPIQSKNRNQFKVGPTYINEIEARKKGFNIVCGIDEAGRGAIAGPLIACALVLPEKCRIKFNDSKLLSSKQREYFFEEINKIAKWSIGIAEVDEINKNGIQGATYSAYHNAIDGLDLKIEFLLTDHYYLPSCKVTQKNITHGDRLCQSIAAASIMAKVSRDRLMRKIAEEKSNVFYGFENHFGYGTKMHREAILRYGPCKLHRTKFVKTFTQNISQI